MILELYESKKYAEQAILGAVLVDGRWAGEMLSRLHQEDFGSELRPVYLAVRSLYQDGKAVDPVTVMERLAGIGEERVRRSLMMELMEATPTATTCGEYIDILLRTNSLLHLREVAERFSAEPSRDGISELMEAAGAALGETGHTQRFRPEDRWLRFLERQTGPQPEYVDWGFEPLNRTIQTEPGDFVVIGAEPNGGKTALAIQLADGQARKMRVGFYSLETAEAKITNRQFAMRYGVSLGEIKSQSIPEPKWEDMIQAAEEFKATSFDVIEAAGWSVLDIETDAVAHNYDLIYVDYLQLTKWEPGESEYEAVTRASKQLHTLAQRRKITVVALSQFSRMRGEQEPNMHSLRSSGQIEADADVIMLLFCSSQDQNDPNTRRLRIVKSKEGPRGFIPLTFDGKTQRFELNQEAIVKYRKENSRA
jgi:replicative DNA helicase